MSTIQRALVKQLAHKMKEYGKRPRFAFLLGAGASRDSRIITATEMIRHFKERIVVECCPDNLKTDEEKEKWLSEQDWNKKDGNEYCKFFEQFEPKEIGRQRYIERIIEGREPSFGYVVLANLMASGYINTIITTNFDDLVYSACTSYTSIRPIVYAYGVLASEMRITAQRPKILKLHGDYLYSTIKNTTSETNAQDPNMARQLMQVLNEYGLVVLGYSGGDKSVMDILHQFSERNDLYWCVMRGKEPGEAERNLNEDVKKLLREKRGFLVEIDGFDKMMNEIRGIVGFDVNEMVGSIKARQNQMIEDFKKFEANYSADILGDIVQAVKEQPTGERESNTLQSVDFFTKAYKAQNDGKPAEAAAFYRKAIELDANYAAAYVNLGALLAEDAARYPEAEALFRKAIELAPNDALAYYNLGKMVSDDTARYSEALAFYRKAIELDPDYTAAYVNLGLLLTKDPAHYPEAEALYRKAIELDAKDTDAYVNLGALLTKDPARYPEAEALYRKAIELDANNDGTYYNLACLESLRGNTDAAIEGLRRATQIDSSKRDLAKTDSDFNGIRNDPRFKQIVEEDEA